MRILIVFLLSLPLFLTTLNDQTPAVQLSEGDTLMIGQSKSYGFDHIKFTKSNFLIKQGKIPNHGKAEGMTVVIDEISEDQSVAYLAPVSKDKFYDGKKRVKTYLKKAIAAGELSIIRP